MSQAPVIIDSGGANLASLQFALERLDASCHGDQRPEDRRRGAARHPAGRRLRARRHESPARDAASHEVLPTLKQPVLGICLGMQLLFARSEEGPTDCLGVIPDTVRRLKAEPGRPVPHMGWNQLTPCATDPLLEGIAENDYVYFVHSYAAPVSTVTLATHGLRRAGLGRRPPRQLLGHAVPSRALRARRARASSPTFSG